MRIKSIVEEDFTNYKVPAMFIGTISCCGKCCKEAGIPLSVCQNNALRSVDPITIDDLELCKRYLANHLTNAIVFGGLEPFEQFQEIEEFIHTLRLDCGCSDDVVIYTGYNSEEIADQVRRLSVYKNIVVKYGRYIPDSAPVYDPILGITLISSNQYAERTS